MSIDCAHSLEVDVGRRRRRDQRPAADPRTGHVATERGAGALVEVGDVVRGVPRRVRDAPVADRLAAGQHAQVALRDRDDIAPQPVEVVAVQPSRARHEPLRVGEVRRAALVDPYLEVRPAAHQRAGGARVVEVDVGQQQGARTSSPSASSSVCVGGLGAGIDEHVADLMSADAMRHTLEHHVDLAGHGVSHGRPRCPDSWSPGRGRSTTRGGSRSRRDPARAAPAPTTARRRRSPPRAATGR